MLVSIRLVTTYLSPKEVGNYYIILATLAFFNLVLLNPPGMYFSRHLLQWKKSKNLTNALFVFFIWILLVSVIAIPVSIFMYYELNYTDKFSLLLFVFYIISAIIVSTVHRNVLYGSNTLGFRKEFVKYLIITLIIGLSISIFIVNAYQKTALYWLFGVIISELIMLYFILQFFIQNNKLNLNKIKNTLSKDKIKKILAFSLPIGLTTFLMWGQNTAYRFIVDYQYSIEILGYIAIGLGIATSVFSSIESISMQYFNPIFLKKILNVSKEKRAEVWNDIAKQIVPIYILAVFFTISMSEVLINILVDHKFHDSYLYTMIGVGIEFFRVMTNLLNNVSQSEYKTTSTIKPYLIGFIVSLGVLSSIDFGTNYFMIPITLAFSFCLVYIYMYMQMKKILDIKYDINFLKIVLLAIPFSLVYFINIEKENMIQNLFLLVCFGLYFLYTIWTTIKESKREIKR